ncbi:AcrR family transcriptional regulator [Salirhabdus euzebyi]|uniref:AcrR family transcriptional regulator n=1 Tax=Salirhabdus euzebyi TaxID=394506 RepID=A0A841PSD4_9BACI|nr:TetR/AcrR family transcriptional regulator [Salirhabdus euzebyi]MBB6451700.1 AcrR family transcriptional regulator [Salirhabdus euzebyi]
MFAEKGYTSLSMRKIAKELGVTTGTLYHYFNSKEDIFRQLTEQISQENIEASSKMTSPSLTFEERLDSFLHFIKGYEGRWMQTMLILMEVIRSESFENKECYTSYNREVERHIDWTANYLQVEDKESVRYLLLLLQGIIFHRYLGGSAVSIDKQLEIVKGIFTGYIKQKSS